MYINSDRKNPNQTKNSSTQSYMNFVISIKNKQTSKTQTTQTSKQNTPKSKPTKKQKIKPKQTKPKMQPQLNV